MALFLSFLGEMEKKSGGGKERFLRSFQGVAAAFPVALTVNTPENTVLLRLHHVEKHAFDCLLP